MAFHVTHGVVLAFALLLNVFLGLAQYNLLVIWHSISVIVISMIMHVLWFKGCVVRCVALSSSSATPNRFHSHCLQSSLISSSSQMITLSVTIEVRRSSELILSYCLVVSCAFFYNCSTYKLASKRDSQCHWSHVGLSYRQIQVKVIK